MQHYPRAIQWRKIERVIRALLGTHKKISRVEGYDISNISGHEATGSMVVFAGGIPAKAEYRKFRIKTVHQISDVDMLKEVMRRRFSHPEWTLPDLIIIDGGLPQLNAVKNSIPAQAHAHTILTALAKQEEELYTTVRTRPIPLKTLPPETMFFFQRVRDESHRFAKKYHHKLREIMYKGGVRSHSRV